MTERKKTSLKGTISPVITVFNKDETIDEKGTVDHARYLLKHGVQGFVVLGSSAETVSMTLHERKRLAELFVTEFGDLVPVCIGSGAYRTKDTIELSRHAQALGVDSIIVIPPYYMGLTKEQVFNYYKELANVVDIPVILYYNPGASGVKLETLEIAKFYELGLIQGVKLTLDNCDVSQVHDLRYLCGPDFRIFYGADVCALEGLLCGADGWISTLINLIPKISRMLCDAAHAGRRNDAREIWEKMLPLIHFELAVADEREPHWLSLVKSGLEAFGYPVGKPRRPLLPLSSEQTDRLFSIVSEINAYSHNNLSNTEFR